MRFGVAPIRGGQIPEPRSSRLLPRVRRECLWPIKLAA
jgi:hypothetical protein